LESPRELRSPSPDEGLAEIVPQPGQFLQSKSQIRWSGFRIVDVASYRKEETVMKTDLVLTMDEYLNACCVAPRVKPPAGEARHIPITEKTVVDPRPNEHGCRCDRWGHPCPGCVENKK